MYPVKINRLKKLMEPYKLLIEPYKRICIFSLSSDFLLKIFVTIKNIIAKK